MRCCACRKNYGDYCDIQRTGQSAAAETAFPRCRTKGRCSQRSTAATSRLHVASPSECESDGGRQRFRKGPGAHEGMGGHRSGRLRGSHSLSPMRLFKYRVPADDPKIHDSSPRHCALRAENHSQGVLLPGLPLHLEQPGGAYHWAALASVFSRRGNELVPWQKSEDGCGEPNSDEESVYRSM